MNTNAAGGDDSRPPTTGPSGGRPGPPSPWLAWGPPARPLAAVPLRFGSSADRDAIRNISAGTRVGDTLFIAADEACSLERLAIAADGCTAAGPIALADLLPLDGEQEADLEGLAEDDGWLWVVGSHARCRRKPEKEEDETIDLDRLADLKDTRPRCLLARLPLIATAEGHRPVARDGKRRAGMLKQTDRGNALAKALRKDALIGPFCALPAKEGGLDIEGIAVSGNRVALGLRGPVVGRHAVLLELTLKNGKAGALKLDGSPVKRLLAMEGLGIRDLKLSGDDLLILAGPTTALSGPVALYRWRDWANDPPHGAHQVRLHRPERILDLPFGRGVDHPEGLALWNEDSLLVICDSPSPARIDGGTIKADLFALPAVRAQVNC